MTRRAVFLDRDGVLIVDRGYIGDPDLVELLPGVAENLKALCAADWLLVIVTNQSGIGRGLFSSYDYGVVNGRMNALLQDGGVRLDASFHCPHKPEDGCVCRKPMPGLFLEAADELDIDLSASVMAGDKMTDALASIRAGVPHCFIGHNALADCVESLCHA